MDIGKIGSAILIFFLGIVEVMLGFRFVFKLLAANSTAEFTSFIYSGTEPIVSPFLGVFPTFEILQFELEISTALAMIVYAVVGYIFLMLIRHFDGVRVKPQVPGTQAYPHTQQQQFSPQTYYPQQQTQPTQQPPVQQQNQPSYNHPVTSPDQPMQQQPSQNS